MQDLPIYGCGCDFRPTQLVSMTCFSLAFSFTPKSRKARRSIIREACFLFFSADRGETFPWSRRGDSLVTQREGEDMSKLKVGFSSPKGRNR